MTVALAYFLAVTGAGYAVLRALGLAKGPLGLGLAPAAGLAALAVLTTWLWSFRLPPIAGGVAVAAAGLTGLALAARQWTAARDVALASRESRLAFGLLAASVGVAAVVLGVGLAGVSAPLSTDDGAFHVELVQVIRAGERSGQWYPPGLHATFAALLQWFPGVDTADGVVQASIGLSLLAPLAAFGLASAAWGSPLAAALGAVLVALAFQYPYQPHFWGGWPLAAVILLTLGLWTVGLEHLRRPSWRWAALGGLLAAGVVLTHGTEAIGAALGLAVLLAGVWRRAPWRRLPRDLGVAVLVAAALLAPYVPVLLGFFGGGGATEGGTVESAVSAASAGTRDVGTDLFTLLLESTGAGPLVDLPLRVALLAVGVAWMARRRAGRAVALLGGLFLALAVAFSYVQAPAIQRVFVLTYPWGYDYRLIMVTAVVCSLAEGVGLWAVGRWLAGLRARWPDAFGPAHPVAWRRARRLGVAGATIGLVGLAGMLAVLLATASRAYRMYTADDAAAMAWMREHVRPGEVVANDGYADAGIWAPEKAGVTILKPRILWADPDATKVVLDNVGDFEAAPDAEAMACRLGVRYVYRGAAEGHWQKRHFPPLEDLRASPALEEVFSSGDAAVFRVRCP